MRSPLLVAFDLAVEMIVQHQIYQVGIALVGCSDIVQEAGAMRSPPARCERFRLEVISYSLDAILSIPNPARSILPI